MMLQIVWFKRDMRTFDNEALSRACTAGPVLCLYVFEPDYWALKDTSNRQWLFIRESLNDLSAQLRVIGGHLTVMNGTVTGALSELRRQVGKFVLHSHEETGNLWTFDRDKNVAAWCRAQGCDWFQYAQNGVCRPVSRRRERFKAHWDAWSARPVFCVPQQAEFVTTLTGLTAEQLPASACADLLPCPGRQAGGREAGLTVLKDFLHRRSEKYSGAISSPVTAEDGCSRLSPHIANGTLSLREIAQRVTALRTQTLSQQWKKSLSAFHTRLWWHCYFIQTLENQPEMEEKPLVPQMGLLERPFNQERFDAWKDGRTGWPMVDACMRYLHHHGWINFRMRAMLVSAASWSLSLPSGPVAAWLAQLFVDYDPGIHYPQIQMQSGMAANGVLRIYNPVMQAHTLDPDARFVRQWVPELRVVSDVWIFEPWKMPSSLQKQAEHLSGVPVCLPLVDFAVAHREAKAAVSTLRQRHGLSPAPGFREKPNGQHVRRTAAPEKSGNKKKKDTKQLDLF
ncbi:FAD-binding domain-containing protein [Pectobacterium odoriferum]|uniref:Photolyase/cryptochrome alpha/beta domain-containing protein n=1 Tax=Pectobacterium odoriferum TaxID=78398 RepID=A0ABR4VSE6_9GAMM|nr:FAD-binding domain-containing protein [Pectobacterium odoriferum]KGA42279.1 hypothetical protein KU75_06100 [Pectobacterium odoriferum]MCA6962129.1 deoxyribodipyrimidine photo-lyase [Pectobacterium odoriferum]MCH5010228.1 deoxyribodipyrimidine photo-lyase [Pectobacterium odoriferum]